MAGRFLVGIDLGTTNTACAYVDTTAGPAIRVFDIPQLVAPGRVEPRPTLPSFVYLAGDHDLPAGSLDLPWASGRDWCVGTLAREQGARVPGRLVASAKSWLCHGGVDRLAPCLPWGALPDVTKIAPVDAQARILSHLREAWDATFPEPLAAQSIVLTVPASFDEVARELTIEATRRAGLDQVVLLEEPQAAFYAWITDHEGDWRERVQDTPLVLVVDVGGGTTDFSLIGARASRGELALERVAVGDHVLLGGDNMDLTLARAVEARLTSSGPLDGQRFHGLVSQCRAAKERLLSEARLKEVRVTVAGRGGAVIGGALTGAIMRDEVERTVLDGFFPVVDATARPQRTSAGGLREWGLPFAAEPAVTKHLADFLVRQRDAAGETVRPLVRPDAVLMNGGALEPEPVRQRLAEVIGRWHDPYGTWQPAVLDASSLQLAVARGAAYYARARRGEGVRIGSGAARTYYLGLGGPIGEMLCLVPRGMEEGESADLSMHEFELLTNRPVEFPLFTATDRTGESVGDVAAIPETELQALPAIRTVLRFGKKLEARALPVHLEVRLTEIGTLELWCRSRVTEHRWRLEFRLRGATAAEPGASPDGTGLVVDTTRVDAAAAAVRAVFGGGDDPVTLMRRLEQVLDAGRDAWPVTTIRALWDVLWDGERGRTRTADHEARWLNLAGYLLRPGFGDPGDPIRIDRLWRVLSAGLAHPRAAQPRAEWWNLWKRIAGGLNARQQQLLWQRVSPVLVKRGKLPPGPRPGPQEVREMWQAIAGCERLPGPSRVELFEAVLAAAVKGRASTQELWALARLGAREPVAGSATAVVPREVATRAVTQLLACEWPRVEAYAFALAQIARVTGDRERDLDPATRERAAARLDLCGDGARLARLAREHVPLDTQDEARLLDESLPAGLRLRT